MRLYTGGSAAKQRLYTGVVLLSRGFILLMELCRTVGTHKKLKSVPPFHKGLNCIHNKTQTNYKRAKSQRSSYQFRNSTERAVAESKPKYEHPKKCS